VLGLAGLVGAALAELLRALFGLDPIRSGQVSLLALAGPRSPAERWASGAGFLSEDRKEEGLALRLSVAENLLLPVLARSAGGGWLRKGAPNFFPRYQTPPAIRRKFAQ
jgi:ribose transport system ATP-binding protein